MFIVYIHPFYPYQIDPCLLKLNEQTTLFATERRQKALPARRCHLGIMEVANICLAIFRKMQICSRHFHPNCVFPCRIYKARDQDSICFYIQEYFLKKFIRLSNCIYFKRKCLILAQYMTYWSFFLK